jgi:hypothetical protein
VKHLLCVNEDGSVRGIYSDDLARLYQLATGIRTVRVSNVEPTSDGHWQADLSPIGGPKLPKTKTRKASLDAEVKWLKENYL